MLWQESLQHTKETGTHTRARARQAEEALWLQTALRREKRHRLTPKAGTICPTRARLAPGTYARRALRSRAGPSGWLAGYELELAARRRAGLGYRNRERLAGEQR